MKAVITIVLGLIVLVGQGQIEIENYKLKNDSVRKIVYQYDQEKIYNPRSCITDWSSGEGECSDNYGKYQITVEGEKVIEIYKSGIVRREINYKGKVRKGVTVINYPGSGNKFAEVYYDDGKIWNVKYFTQKGEAMDNGGFIDGVGILKIYRFTGSVMQAIEFKEGQPNGTCSYYYSDGKVLANGTYRFGRPDGYWNEYYPNGREAQMTKMAMGLVVKTEAK